MYTRINLPCACAAPVGPNPIALYTSQVQPTAILFGAS